MSSDRESPFPLPDLTEIPPVGSREREAHEEAALARGRELIHIEDGRLCDALYTLEQELRGDGWLRTTNLASALARDYARLLCRHVEQCWATAVLR